jgi:hypothetical protein
MPDPDCHVPIMCIANADSNSYIDCDWDTYRHAYSHAM